VKESSMTFAYAIRINWMYAVTGLMLILLVYVSIIQGMVLDWYNDDNYSHGFLVPFISGWFVWTNWEKISLAEVRPALRGLPVIVCALLLLVLAWFGTEYFTMRSSMIVLLAGGILFIYGVEVFRELRLPLGYLFFMVPVPYIIYDAVAFSLKMFVSWLSVNVLQFIGLLVMREGNIIQFPNITLEVADACSGLRSLVSLLALSVAISFISQKKTWKRWVLALSAVPVAVLTNALRVIVTGILSKYYGQAAAEGFFHEFAGMMVFGVALAMLGVIAALLRMKEE